MKIAVLMTCFNRKEKTRICLQRLAVATSLVDEDLFVSLVDAGDDATAELATEFDFVESIRSPGLYWAGGMRLAESTVLDSDRSPDFLLWLNDDVYLDANSLAKILNCSKRNPNSIVVGSLRGATGEVTYGGLIRSRINPLRYHLYTKDIEAEVDGFCGNVVLVPRLVYENLGRISERFVHTLADREYGIRARHSSIPIVVPGGTVGFCEQNAPGGTLADENMSFLARIKMISDAKGPPQGEWNYVARLECVWWWLFAYMRLHHFVTAPIRRLVSSRAASRNL